MKVANLPKVEWNRAVRAQLSRALARNQLSPRSHQLHGIQEFALAGALGGVAQARAALLHALVVWTSGLVHHTVAGFVQRIRRWSEPATASRHSA